MTDNLLQLIDLQADLLLADLNDRTKRCAIAWDRVSPTTYHCYFEWGNDWYDAYVTLMRGSYGLDLIKNERLVLNINSYINDQVAVLYYVITDTFDDHEIKQIIQDINTLASCKNVVRKAALGGVTVGGTAVVVYYRYVIGGVTVGGTASLAGAPATFTNDGIAEYDGYSYSNFDEFGTLLTSGTIDAPMGFFYGPGEFEYGDPCCKLGGNFALLPPYVKINNYTGQFLAPFTPKTATYQKINGVTQSSVTQPSSDDFNLLGGQANNETVMLINIRSPNGTGYYKLFLNLIFASGWQGLPKTVSVRAYMGYSNNTGPTYMPSLTSDFSGLPLTDAVSQMVVYGDAMNAFEISDVIAEVIAQEWWDSSSYGIMLEVRQETAPDSYNVVYNSLSPYTSPDIFEFNPSNFVIRSNAYIRFTMNQSEIADDSILSIVKAEEASSGTTTLQIRAVKDPNIAWPSSEADLDYDFTTAFVSYEIDLSDEIGTQYDIDVTEIVQEIIDQEDWLPGNAIMFVLFDGMQLKTYHVQQLIPEIFTPISFASEETTLYPHATLTFTPATRVVGGVTCGGTAKVGDGAMLYIANANGTGSFESWRLSSSPRTILTGLTNISCVRTDIEYGKIFWSQVELTGSNPSGTSLFCCNMDGTDVTEIASLSTFDGIRSFDLDRVNSKIYLVVDRNWNGGSNVIYYVMRCDYDGANLQDVHNGTNPFLRSPTGLTVDVNYGYVFWCDSYGLEQGAVHRCDLDGSNYVQLLSTTGLVRAVCAYNSELYMGGSGVLTKTDLNGENQEFLSFLQLSVVVSIDIKVEDPNDLDGPANMYIADSGVNKVFINDLTGFSRTAIINDSDPRVAVCVPL